MKHRFDELIDRRGTGSFKHDFTARQFGTDDIIPLWVADMDFRAPEFVVRALDRRVSHGIFGYGLRGDGFNDSIAEWMRRRHGWEIAPEWISFSPGVVPALCLCVLAYTSPGDSVIVQPPVYHLFFSAVRDHGRIPVFNRLLEREGRYAMDFADIEAHMRAGARALLLCNPHNPVGRVWSGEELGRVARLCGEYDVTVISDEIHSDLVFDGYRHLPFAGLSPDAAARTVTCVSPSKTFNLAGLATAAVIISDEGMRREFRRALNALHLGGGNVFGDCALEAAYNEGDSWLEELLDYLEANRDYAVDRVNHGLPGISATGPESTYLLWMDCRGMGLDDRELHRFMVERARLGLSDGPVFGPGGSGFQRLNFACPRSLLEEALDRMDRAIRRG